MTIPMISLNTRELRSRWHSNVLEVHSFRGADYDTDHYLAVAKGREYWQRVSQQRTNFKWEVKSQGTKEHCRIEISNRFAVLQNLDDDGEINRAWETISEKTKFQRKRV
jgi:hypothetical protein